MNQCDGCRRGLPLTMGIHKGVGWDAIGCTAHLYKEVNMKTCSRCHRDVEELAFDARCSKCTDYGMYETIREVEFVEDPVIEEVAVKPKRKRKKKVKEDKVAIDDVGIVAGDDQFLDFLDNIPADADNYEVEKFDGEEDEGCGDACKI